MLARAALRVAARPRTLPLGARGLAKKPAAGASDADDSGPTDLEKVVTGLNIMKDGKDPLVKPDSEYPDWVFELHKPLPTLEELVAKHEANPDSLGRAEQKRLVRQWNRERIRRGNGTLS